VVVEIMQGQACAERGGDETGVRTPATQYRGDGARCFSGVIRERVHSSSRQDKTEHKSKRDTTIMIMNK
jgi:hypothetical protein